MVRFFHKLANADRRLTRQDRLFAHLLGSPEGCPTPPRKTDDYCDDGPANKTPNSKLNFPCSFWFHLILPILIYMNQMAFETHDRSHSFDQKQRRHHLSVFLKGTNLV
jgi:hypothetical protein